MKKWLNMLFKHLFGRYVCVVVFLLGHLSTSKASHLVGGDIAVKWISGNNFEITLNYYRDCKNGQTSLATTVDVGLYELQTNTYEFPISLPLTSSSILSLGDKCNDVSNLICV